MQLLIDLIIIIILGFLTATIGHCFQMFMQPGMIFNFYSSWLYDLSEKSKFWEHITKPLGMCIYCNTTWVAIIVWFIKYCLITQNTIKPVDILDLFFLIGVTWFFIKIINKLFFD